MTQLSFPYQNPSARLEKKNKNSFETNKTELFDELIKIFNHFIDILFPGDTDLQVELLSQVSGYLTKENVKINSIVSKYCFETEKEQQNGFHFLNSSNFLDTFSKEIKGQDCQLQIAIESIQIFVKNFENPGRQAIQISDSNSDSDSSLLLQGLRNYKPFHVGSIMFPTLTCLLGLYSDLELFLDNK